MTWGRVDESWRTHRKVLAAGPEAGGFWWACVCYSNLHLTDGYIPRSELRHVWPGLHPRRVSRLVATLLGVLLLEESDSSPISRADPSDLTRGSFVVVHDFLDFNDSRTKVLEKRRKEREKKARQRSLSPGDSRRDSPGVSLARAPASPDPTRPDPSIATVPVAPVAPPPADARVPSDDIEELQTRLAPSAPWDEARKRAARCRSTGRMQDGPWLTVLRGLEAYPDEAGEAVSRYVDGDHEGKREKYIVGIARGLAEDRKRGNGQRAGGMQPPAPASAFEGAEERNAERRRREGTTF